MSQTSLVCLWCEAALPEGNILRKYCNSACKANYRRHGKLSRAEFIALHPATKICLNCGEPFAVNASMFEIRKFCSRACKTDYGYYGRSKADRLASAPEFKICIQCGTKFYRAEKLNGWSQKKYCCSECKSRYQFEHLGGSFVWKVTVRYLINVERRPCVQCGETDTSKLQVDHILARCLGGTNDMSNLQVLCRSCHSVKTKSDIRRAREAAY